MYFQFERKVISLGKKPLRIFADMPGSMPGWTIPLPSDGYGLVQPQPVVSRWMLFCSALCHDLALRKTDRVSGAGPDRGNNCPS